MAEHLPELWPEALEITRQIKDEYSRSRALSAMAKHLSETLLPEALEMTRQIKDKYSRSRALSAMAEHLPELWLEALEITRQIKDESARSMALSNMAQYLPEVLLPGAFDTIWAIQDKYYCANALQGYLPYLGYLSMSFTQLTDILDILAYQNRAQLLDALPQIRPMIIRLGNEQAFSETLKAVRDVCQQWP